MDRRDFLWRMPIVGVSGLALTELGAVPENRSQVNQLSDRDYTARLLYRIAEPVLRNLNSQTLKKEMPLQQPKDYNTDAAQLSYLEAFGRTICGIAPWLRLPDDSTKEGQMRKELREYALNGMAHAVDPKSHDYMNFRRLEPPIVHAAHLCQGLLRAPEVLWNPLDSSAKANFVSELKALRRIKGPYNNWLLFAGMIETFLLFIEEEYEPLRIMVAIKKIQEWYVGDGWYRDGVHFAFDYYNGYVIHSMLTDILEVAKHHKLAKPEEYEQALARMQRFAVIQERLIAPDGTFPVVGRSMTYRTAAFQPLAQLALMRKLPQEISGAQVRCALTAVMKQIFEAKATFNAKGWLQLGLAGYQPSLADVYTSTGSLYICTEGFLALGLPANDAFWTAPAAQWTAQKVWTGADLVRDHSLEG
jgi:hypothetical protein